MRTCFTEGCARPPVFAGRYTDERTYACAPCYYRLFPEGNAIYAPWPFPAGTVLVDLSPERPLRSDEAVWLDAPLSEFEAVLAEILELHRRKNKDYGSDVDPYANVTDSREWGVPPWVGAGVRISDKERRLKLFAQTGGLENESVEDSLKDNCVYNIIRLILWRRERNEKA